MELLRIKKFSDLDIPLPTRTHDTDAGLDFYAPFDFSIAKGTLVLIPSGYGIGLEPGYVGLFRDRSSVGSKGVIVVGGVIDADYRGQIIIGLANVAYNDVIHDVYHVKKGDKIAQMIITRVYTPKLVLVDDFESTVRGSNGFGSSGR